MPVISSRSVSGEQDVGEMKTPVTLSDQVPANSTKTLEYEVPANATVERFQVRIYQGAQLDLQLEPEIVPPSGAGQATRLVDLVGKEYIDGDDDVFRWDLSRPVEEDATIRIRATNQDGSNAYDYRALLEVEYEGGLQRRLTALAERVAGVL